MKAASPELLTASRETSREPRANAKIPVSSSPASRRAPKTAPLTPSGAAHRGVTHRAAINNGAANEGVVKEGSVSGSAMEVSEGDATKKRVRLKPETREQLLERLRNPELSLHEASILLRVSRATVRRYADAGRLPCQRTTGGQRRFFMRDIEMFYRQLKARK